MRIIASLLLESASGSEDPVVPCGPAGPRAPGGPVSCAPGAPGAPVAPVEPVAPVPPCSPFGPVPAVPDVVNPTAGRRPDRVDRDDLEVVVGLRRQVAAQHAVGPDGRVAVADRTEERGQGRDPGRERPGQARADLVVVRGVRARGVIRLLRIAVVALAAASSVVASGAQSVENDFVAPSVGVALAVLLASIRK